MLNWLGRLDSVRERLGYPSVLSSVPLGRRRFSRHGDGLIRCCACVIDMNVIVSLPKSCSSVEEAFVPTQSVGIVYDDRTQATHPDRKYTLIG